MSDVIEPLAREIAATMEAAGLFQARTIEVAQELHRPILDAAMERAVEILAGRYSSRGRCDPVVGCRNVHHNEIDCLHSHLTLADYCEPCLERVHSSVRAETPRYPKRKFTEEKHSGA